VEKPAINTASILTIHLQAKHQSVLFFHCPRKEHWRWVSHVFFNEPDVTNQQCHS